MVVNTRRSGWFLAMVLALAVAGCDSSGNSGGGASLDDMAGAMEAQKTTKAQQEKAQQDAERATQESQQAAAEKEQSTSNAPDERQRTAAGRPGVGEGGYYTAIVGARRHILNKVDDLAWIQAVQHFKATEGRLPKDHAEFMSKVVKPLEINLGYKEENQEFLYDPSAGDWGEVYVVEKEPTK